MRYSIFEFNQQLSIEAGLTITDLLLLDYIQKAASNPKMKHSKADVLCVWLNHDKILQDLPILNVSESTLKRWLSNLVKKGFLKREITHSNSFGIRAYYGITDKLVELQFSRIINETRDEISGLTDNTREGISGLTDEPSDSILKDNKKLNNTIIKNNSRKLVKPKSLYESCREMIVLYTKDKPELYNLLEQYLRLRLEMKDKPLYKNQWKGILNKLDKIHEEEGQSYKDIIQFNIEKGYASFFPMPNYNKKFEKKKKEYNLGLCNDTYTEEEKEEIRKWQEEQIAKGERIVF